MRFAVTLLACASLALTVASSASAAYHGYIYDGGKFSSFDFGTGNETSLRGINDAGDILGYYYPAQPVAFGHPFIISGGKITQINVPASIDSVAWDINNHGQIVGGAAPDTDTSLGFKFDPGIGYTLYAYETGQFHGTELRGINDAGDYVGWTLNGGFTFIGGKFQSFSYKGERAYAADINNVGSVLGFFQDPNNGYNFTSFVKNGDFTTLYESDNFGIRLWSMNDVGQLVGERFQGQSGFGTAILYNANGTVTDISYPGSTNSGAFGINNLGQIVGFWGDNPIPSNDGVPEPASWAMMIAGFGAVGASMRRRRRHWAAG